MDQNMLKLIVPILLSMISSILLIFRSSLLTATIMNAVILILGSLWFWATVTDGLAQVTQAVLYSISFVVILLITVVVAVIKKRRTKIANGSR